MRMYSLGAGVLACMVSSGAYAETWNIRSTLDKSRSAAACGDNTPPSTLTYVGDKLTLNGSNGIFNFKVAPDGTVNDSFRTPSGMSLQIVGNARTKELEFVNTSAGCRYRAVVQ